jgi:hypothetical protein
LTLRLGGPKVVRNITTATAVVSALSFLFTTNTLRRMFAMLNDIDPIGEKSEITTLISIGLVLAIRTLRCTRQCFPLLAYAYLSVCLE